MHNRGINVVLYRRSRTVGVDGAIGLGMVATYMIQASTKVRIIREVDR